MTPTSPTTTQEQVPARAGFSLPVDMVVAPGRGFLKIARRAEWVPALIVIAVCAAGSIELATPALTHLFSLAKTPDAPKQDDVIFRLAYDTFAAPLMGCGLIAFLLTLLARRKDPAAPFARFFSLAINCQVPAALGNLLHTAAVAARGPGADGSFRAFVNALPDTLAVLASPGNDRELDFLANFSAFDAWSYVLLGFGISLFLGIRFPAALSLAAILYFVYVFGFS